MIFSLVLVHPLIGQADELVLGGSFGGEGGYADARPDAGIDAFLFEVCRSNDELAHAFSEPFGRRVIRVGQDHDELVATVAGSDIGLADRGTQQESHFAQHLAPPKMSVLVVDLLELVEVHEDQAQTRLVPCDELELAVESLVKVAKIEERAHIVEDRRLLRLLIELDVLDRDGDLFRELREKREIFL